MKILWDFNFHADKVMHHRRPDIVVDNSAEKTVEIIDVAIPGDKRVQEKEKEKFDHYADLKIELQRIWHSKISITPVDIGVLGTVSKDHKKFLIKINMAHKQNKIQKCPREGIV